MLLLFHRFARSWRRDPFPFFERWFRFLFAERTERTRIAGTRGVCIRDIIRIRIRSSSSCFTNSYSSFVRSRRSLARSHAGRQAEAREWMRAEAGAASAKRALVRWR